MARLDLDVRRLAAVDMHGLKGTRFRARLILVEFVAGVVLGVLLGLALVVAGTSVGARLFGVWLLGVGLNYVPLALHAFSLSRREVLAAELEGVDIRQELRYYTAAQLWVFVPLALVVFALRQRTPARPPA